MEQKNNFDIFDELDIKEIDLSIIKKVNKLSDLLYTMMKKRIDSKLSQRDLAKLTGIKQPMLARIEKMTSIPRLDTFISIIDALGLDIKLVKEDEKICESHISKYIESKIDATPKELEKLVYYVQVFDMTLNNKNSNKEYGYHLIEEQEEYDDLDPKLKEVVDAVIKYFGIYSANTLEYFTHQEEPYLKALNSESKVIEKSDIKEYGEKIIKEYNINSPKEIYKYSEAMFNKFKEENK